MSVELTYLGHSGCLINHENTSVVIDPFLTSNPISVHDPSDIQSGFVVLTHGHFDHIEDAEEIAKNNKAKIFAPYELAEYFSEKNIETEGGNPGGTIKTEFGSVTFTKAFHSSSFNGKYLGEACGIVLQIGSKTIYHAGDTDIFSDMELIGKIYRPDISLLPVGDRFTMGPELATRAAEMIGSPVVVPIHHSTWPPIEVDLSKFSPKDVSVKIMKPGSKILVN